MGRALVMQVQPAWFLWRRSGKGTNISSQNTNKQTQQENYNTKKKCQRTNYSYIIDLTASVELILVCNHRALFQDTVGFLLTNREQVSSEMREMSSACWMTLSRSFSWEMKGQRVMLTCSSLQSSGTLTVNMQGHSRRAHAAVCFTEGKYKHVQTQTP